MKFYSSRDQTHVKSFKEACLQGQASDGGLFIPVSFPKLELPSRKLTLIEVAQIIFKAFAGDELSDQQIASIAATALNFPCPITAHGKDGPFLLELFHGPTNAFKDVGARTMAQLFHEFQAKGTILVATSGDTGGAVASAFHHIPDLNVVILFPAKGVSELQERQLTCWGDNVLSLKVAGDFDDCQRLVKEFFADAALSKRLQLTSANSINIGRLIPQMTYYYWCAHHYWQEHQRPVNFYIPTGNMGNAMAAVWARECGAPIDQLHLATNANPTLAQYFTHGQFAPAKSIRTLANAMDVGLPSNLERYRSGELNRRHIDVQKVSDADIKSTIASVFQEHNYILCPHSACAYKMFLDHPVPDAFIVCTAHPAKFNEVIQVVLKQSAPVPRSLQQLTSGPFYGQSVAADKQAILNLIERHHEN